MHAGHGSKRCLLFYIGIESLKIGELQKVGGEECEGLVGGRKGVEERQKEGRKDRRKGPREGGGGREGRRREG